MVGFPAVFLESLNNIVFNNKRGCFLRCEKKDIAFGLEMRTGIKETTVL